MRLSRIEIENFKGIGNRQVIELKPITLLFGPNSAGKSTILQALHYVREVLERRNPDPDQTIAGGLIDLGGFRNLIHNHDLSKTMTIKLVIDLSDDQGSERLPLNSGTSIGLSEFENLQLRYLVGDNSELKDYVIVQEVGIFLSVKWSDLADGPFVSELSVEMDGQNFASIISPPGESRAQLKAFNFAHPLLDKIIDPNDFDPEEDQIAGDPFNSPLGSEIWELSREIAADGSSNQDSEFRIAVKSAAGALPDINLPLGLSLRDPDVSKAELEESTTRVKELAELLDELVLGPVRIVRDCLNTMTYIGPLRDIPPRSFRPQKSPDEARWAQGLAAWDMLYNDTKGNLIKRVNSWMSDKERLNTTYTISKSEFIQLPASSRLAQLFKRGVAEDDLGELQEEFLKLSSISDIVLQDTIKSIDVAPADVGVGISQMIPVVVGCLRDQGGILAIEQPELHIHPAIQVGIGDLFIHAIQSGENSFGSGKTLLVETHSEHIMLRLLRRVRETTDKEIPPGMLELKPEDLSVIYVENTQDEVKFRSLRVEKDGDFADQWPDGFFEERGEELF